MNRLVTSANAPDTERWPLTCRSPAIGVSRLTGMNSEATSANAPSDIARTAPHAAAPSGAVPRSGVETDGMSGTGSEKWVARSVAARRGAVPGELRARVVGVTGLYPGRGGWASSTQLRGFIRAGLKPAAS